MKIIGYPNRSAARQWRLEHPFKYLREKGIQADICERGIVDEDLENYDVYVLQSVVDKEGLAKMHYYQQEKGKKIVCDQDDLMETNADNPHNKEHEITDAKFVIEQTLKIADMITTTTDYLANNLKKFNENVQVLPNYMDLSFWDGDVVKNTSNEVRILWTGSMTHYEDLKLVEKPLKKIMDEFPQVKLILFGDLRLRDLFKGYNVEGMLGVPFNVYPSVLRGLQADIGIAPLVDNEFNRNKSNIKTLEYSLIEIPCVASDIEPYSDSLAYRLAKTEDEWYSELKSLVERKTQRETVGALSKEGLVKKYDLSKHIDKWVEAYNSLSYTDGKPNK